MQPANEPTEEGSSSSAAPRACPQCTFQNEPGASRCVDALVRALITFRVQAGRKRRGPGSVVSDTAVQKINVSGGMTTSGGDSNSGSKSSSSSRSDSPAASVQDKTASKRAGKRRKLQDEPTAAKGAKKKSRSKRPRSPSVSPKPRRRGQSSGSDSSSSMSTPYSVRQRARKLAGLIAVQEAELRFEVERDEREKHERRQQKKKREKRKREKYGFIVVLTRT